MPIKFITDSMADLGQGLADEYDFDIIPIPITVGEKTYFDGIDITPEMVMDFGRNGKDFPKTSQVSVGAYKEAFEKHLKNGDDIVYVGLSSGLSGTMQAANIAANELRELYPDRKISLVDSKSVTLGQAMILQQGLKLNKLGKSIEEIEETLNFLADHFNIFFVAGDLKWLSRGGRVSKAAAALGSFLNVVPILYVNDGKIEVFDKVRGKKKAAKKLETILKNALDAEEDQIIGVMDGNNEEFAKRFKKVASKYDHTNVVEPEKGAGSGLTTHIGDNFFGLGFFDELPENYVNVNP